MRMLMSISEKETEQLLEKDSISEVINLSQVPKVCLEVIRNVLSQELLNCEGIVATISKISDDYVSLQENLNDIDDFLDVRAGQILFEVNYGIEECKSIMFSDLMDFCSKYGNCTKDDVPILAKKFKRLLNKEMKDDVITFVPKLYMDKVTSFFMLNNQWEPEEISLGEKVSEIRLEGLQVF